MAVLHLCMRICLYRKKVHGIYIHVYILINCLFNFENFEKNINVFTYWANWADWWYEMF